MGYVSLNCRHEIGLFLTFVATAVGLFMEVSSKQAARIILHGFPFAWLLGSLRFWALGSASCSIARLKAIEFASEYSRRIETWTLHLLT